MEKKKKQKTTNQTTKPQQQQTLTTKLSSQNVVPIQLYIKNTNSGDFIWN